MSCLAFPPSALCNTVRTYSPTALSIVQVSISQYSNTRFVYLSLNVANLLRGVDVKG